MSKIKDQAAQIVAASKKRLKSETDPERKKKWKVIKEEFTKLINKL